MLSGTRFSTRNPTDAADRLRAILGAANCNVTEFSEGTFSFTHGTYLTQSAPLMPKRGRIVLKDDGEGTRIDYQIELTAFPKWWLAFWGILFCWLVFPAVIAYRAIYVHPKLMMENMLSGI